MNKRLRFGLSGVCASSDALNSTPASATSDQSQVFISVVRLTMVAALRSARDCAQPLRRQPGWFLSVFRLHDLAHELDRKLCVLVSEFNPDCFAIHHG